jgi:CTP:molybdopterin cytidylyltransferase MocA
MGLSVVIDVPEKQAAHSRSAACVQGWRHGLCSASRWAMEQGTTVALIVAAGRGERSGQALPKQFARIGGTAMVAHSHRALAAHPGIDRVVVVIGAGQQDLLRAAIGDVEWVEGGATRRESVARGLAYLGGSDVARVLIHDAARPFVPGTVVGRLLAALDKAAGAVPALLPVLSGHSPNLRSFRALRLPAGRALRINFRLWRKSRNAYKRQAHVSRLRSKRTDRGVRGYWGRSYPATTSTASRPRRCSASTRS